MNISITLNPATPEDLEAMLSILSRHGNAPAASPSIRPPSPQVGDRERYLRDQYRIEYNTGFTLKGREGSAISILEALEAAGWPKDETPEAVERKTAPAPALSPNEGF